MDLPDWLRNGAVSYDCETTGTDPATARILTAHAVEISATGAKELGSWFVNPGIPIPEEATKIHGITDAQVADWSKPEDALRSILDVLSAAWKRGAPLIVMNAPYDMSIIDRDARSVYPDWPGCGRCIDPLVIDRGMDQWRKGKRTLSTLAEHYGVRQEDAHSAKGDALCAARIVWAQVGKFARLRTTTLDDLVTWQARKHREWAAGFEQHLRKTKPDAVVDGSWPVRRVA